MAENTILEKQNASTVANEVSSSDPTPSSATNSTEIPKIETREEALKKWETLVSAIASGGDVIAHVTKRWQDARNYRMTNGIDTALLYAVQARRGQYDPDKLALIQQYGGSTVYYRLIAKLCRTGVAAINDAFTSSTSPWKLTPGRLTKIPEDRQKAVSDKIMLKWRTKGMVDGVVPEPEDLRDIANEVICEELEGLHEKNLRASLRMEDKIYDQLGNGSWASAFKDVIDDLCCFKCGCMKGPIPWKGNKLVFKTSAAGRIKPATKTVKMYKFSRVSPFDLFPAAGSSGVDSADFIERGRYKAPDLLQMLGEPGWQDDAVRETVDRYGETGYQYWTTFDLQRAWLEDKGTTPMRMHGFIEVLEYWGHVKGERLNGAMLDKTVDPHKWYHVNAIVCSDQLLYLNVLEDQFAFRPYNVASYMTVPGSFWGEGMWDLVQDLDGFTSGAGRALADNMAMCSRPQKIVDVNQLPPGQDVETTIAGGVTQVSPKPGSTTKPIEFINIDAHTSELLEVARTMETKAYEVVGLPAPDLGNAPVGQAGRTGMGMEMILGNQCRGLRFAIFQIDTMIGRRIFNQLYTLNMLYDEDESIKAECDVEPQGILASIAAMQSDSRQQEFLQAAMLPQNADVITTRGKATMFRQRARFVSFPESVVIDDHTAAKMDEQRREQMEAQKKAQSAEAAPENAAAPEAQPTPTEPQQQAGTANAAA